LNDAYDERIQHSRAQTTPVFPSHRHQQAKKIIFVILFLFLYHPRSAQGRTKPACHGRGVDRQRTLAVGHVETKSGYWDCEIGQMRAQMDAPRPWTLAPTRNRRGTHRSGRRRRRNHRLVEGAAGSFVGSLRWRLKYRWCGCGVPR
jgi:hypothetical protein